MKETNLAQWMDDHNIDALGFVSLPPAVIRKLLAEITRLSQRVEQLERVRGDAQLERVREAAQKMQAERDWYMDHHMVEDTDYNAALETLRTALSGLAGKPEEDAAAQPSQPEPGE